MEDDNTIIALFIGPDDDESCPGCEDAVAGNPYTLDTVPEPGTFRCRGNCRHMVQLASDAPDGMPTFDWRGTLGLGDTGAPPYYEDVTPDQELPSGQLKSIFSDSPPEVARALSPTFYENAIDGSMSNLGKSLSEIFESEEANVMPAMGEFFWDIGLDPTDPLFTIGLNPAQHELLKHAYNFVASQQATPALAQSLLDLGDEDRLRTIIRNVPAFRQTLLNIGRAGADDGDEEKILTLGRVLGLPTYMDSTNQRWYLDVGEAALGGPEVHNE